MLRYVKRQPDGDEKLSSNILMSDVSVTTALRFWSRACDERRIMPKNGELGSWFSTSQSADGTRFAASPGGSTVDTSGSSSEIKPRGSGFVLLTRRNCSRWVSTSSATNALMGIGRSGAWARE